MARQAVTQSLLQVGNQARMVCQDALQEGNERGTLRLRAVIVVHQLGDEIFAPMWAQNAGFEVECSIAEVQQVRMGVKVRRQDRQMGLCFAESVGDARGVQAVGRKPRRALISGLQGLPCKFQDGVLRELAGALAVIHGPALTVPNQPLVERMAVTQILAVESYQALGVAVVAEILAQQIGRGRRLLLKRSFVYWSGVSALPRFPRRPRVGRGQSRLYFLFGVG